MENEYSLDTKLEDFNLSGGQTSANMMKALTIGDPVTSDGTWDTAQINTLFQPYVQLGYPNYSVYWKDEGKFEKAFKLVQRLMDKKVIKEPKTIKDFIELVNIFVEEL